MTETFPPIERRKKPIGSCLEIALDQYFTDIGVYNYPDPTNLYRDVLGLVEPVLLKAVMLRCRYNQGKASRMLGINRNTLRKKLKEYGI